MANVLIHDTTQLTTIGPTTVSFQVAKNQYNTVVRSTKLSGSAVITLYYQGPDGTLDNPSTDDAGQVVTLTPLNPERLINIPGTYRVAVTTVSDTKGVVFVDGS